MAEQNLIDQIGYACKLFVRIVIFALFGLVFSYALNIDDAITCYKIIIGFSLIGCAVGVFDVVKKL